MTSISHQFSIFANSLLLKPFNLSFTTLPHNFSFFIVFLTMTFLIMLLHCIKSFMKKVDFTFQKFLRTLLLVLSLIVFYNIVMSALLYAIFRSKLHEFVYISFYAVIYLPAIVCYFYFVLYFVDIVIALFAFIGTVFVKNNLKCMGLKDCGKWIYGLYLVTVCVIFLYGKVMCMLLDVKKRSNQFIKI